jgi:hypothetical protein
LGIDHCDHSGWIGEAGGVAVRSFFSKANAVIAISVGGLVLLGYFVPVIFEGAREILVRWAIILAGFALLVGVFNLISVHWNKVTTDPKNGVYSGALLISLFVTVILVGINPTGFWSLWLFNHIQIPVETTLMAVLAVVLVYAGARILRRRLDFFSVIFIITALIVLLGAAPIYFLGEIPLLNELRSFVTQVLAVAGARGLLLGVALGAITTGVRVLMGVDRPYGG